MNQKAVVYMLISSVCFAIVNTIVKFLEFPAFEKVFFRCLVSLIITFTLLGRKKIPFFGNNKKYLILRGLSGSVALTMFFIVLERIPLASAVTLQYLSPISTAFFGILILKEKVAWKQWLFFAISFSGIIVMKNFDPNMDFISFIIGISSAALSGIAYVSVRKVKDTDHPLVVVLYFPLVATPLLLIAILLFEFVPSLKATGIEMWRTPHGYEWFLLILLGCITQIAQVTMTKALQSENVAQVTSIKYVGSIFALIIGYSIFDETYSTMALLGIALVLLGVVFSIRYKTKKLSLKN